MEFYKNILFDNVCPWTTTNIVIAGTISVIEPYNPWYLL